MVLTFHFKLIVVLVVTIMAYWSSALSNYCAANIGDMDIGDNNVNISCDIISNNMLNASWTTEEYVDSLRIDYTCTASGLEQVTGTVFGWGRLSEGNNLIEAIYPAATNPSNFEPTCYIDGCYDWTSPRAGFPTWSISTVECTATPETSTVEASLIRTNTLRPPVMTAATRQIPAQSLSSFSIHVAITVIDPSDDQGEAGLMLYYIWIVVGVVIATGMIMTLFGMVVIFAAKKLHSLEDVNGETAEDQQCPHPEIAEHGESPHQLGTLSEEQLFNRSQLPPLGLFRNQEDISEHSQRECLELQNRTEEVASCNTSEITKQRHCPSTLSVEQKVNRSWLPPLKDINKPLQKETRSEESRKLANHNTLVITKHKESPRLGIHAYRFKGEVYRNSCILECPDRFQEPIQGNLTGTAAERHDHTHTGIHANKDEQSRPQRLTEAGDTCTISTTQYNMNNRTKTHQLPISDTLEDISDNNIQQAANKEEDSEDESSPL